jgi:phthiocerol/phenolphthiocerol synthesis type-I polyketide synthase E
VQALEESGFSDSDPNVSLNIISNGLQDVSYPEVIYPEKAPILGLSLVIPQEHRNITCRCIDILLPESDADRGLIQAGQLYEEIKAGSSDRLVAYRGFQRWVKNFSPAPLQGAKDSWRLRHRGVYLITGGLGEIGSEVAQYLARQYQARLVLIGRNGLPPENSWQQWVISHPATDELSQKIRRVRELIELGAEARVISADVSNAGHMRRVVTEIEERFGRLDGVFHAAGIRKGKSASCPVRELGRSESEEQFRPKVYGAYVLSEVLRGKQLDFCLAFSSNASVLGGLGLAAYSAANLFLDVFSVIQNEVGNTRWISANWDGWKHNQITGETDSLRTSLDRYSLSPEESLEALERVLQPMVSGQVVISSGDLSERMNLWVNGEAEHQVLPLRASEMR